MNIPLALRFVSNRVPNHRNRVHQIDGLNGTKDRDQPTNGIEDTYDNQSLTLKDSIKRSKSPQRPPVSFFYVSLYGMEIRSRKSHDFMVGEATNLDVK